MLPVNPETTTVQRERYRDYAVPLKISPKIESKTYIQRCLLAVYENYHPDFLIDDKNRKQIRVFLKYDYQGKPVISAIERVSKPGLRVYKGKKDLPRVLDGLGISIMSTSKGVISNKMAKKFGVGGEVICNVW